MHCPFCAYESDPLVVDDHEDGAILVDRAPMCLGHLIVISPTHSPSAEDMDPAARERFDRRVGFARELSSKIGDAPAIAVEHGRSPTCGDPGCSCHAHVHVVPVGEADTSEFLSRDFLTEATDLAEGSYISVSNSGSDQDHFRPVRPVRHAARTVASVVADQNGVRWRPFAAEPSSELAEATLMAARVELDRLSPRAMRTRGTAKTSRRDSRPIVVVSGSTGSGKTSVGAHLAKALEVPAIELGVILRLSCLHGGDVRQRQAPSTLWRWSKQGRLDFDGQTRHLLAAAVPRLDGSSDELPMWNAIETERLSALARLPEIQEVLASIAASVARERGAVIIGRLSADIDGATTVRLDAGNAERARRKRLQLAGIGLSSSDHDWFTPGQAANRPPVFAGDVLDTTNLSRAAMCASALSRVLVPETVSRRGSG